MTTIAWDGKTVSADSCVSSNKIRVDSLIQGRKLEVHPDHPGVVLAGCGLTSEVASFSSAYFNNQHLPVLRKSEVLVFKDGNCYCYAVGDEVPDMLRPPYACGSGSQLALGAMAAGATSREAVKIAIRYDTGSYGPIRSIEL